MKPPVVDYRKMRLSNITSPQYRHTLLLLGWVGYFIAFLLTENLIPAEKCTPVHCFLDDIVPFCEYFVLAYVGWYVLIVVSLGYFYFHNVKRFTQLQTYIIITQIVAMVIYILFPSRQDLRPEVFPRENFCSALLGLIYAVDTNTGVCPSLHVAYSMGIASTWLREKTVPRWLRGAIAVFCAVICISVAFVKQHSVVDIFAALPVCALAEWWVFYRKRN